MNGNRGKNNVRTMVLKVIAIVLAVILLISAGFFLLEIWEKGHGKYPLKPENLEETLSYKDNKYVVKNNVETILILGLDPFDNQDSGSYGNGRQADFLVLLVIDNSDKTCKAIHINRDTMTEIDVLGVAGDKTGTVTGQIALSHTYGNGREVSCRNTANAVSETLMGVGVDHYVSIAMEAVPVLNDLIGGVTLEVLDDFTGIDDTLVKGETVTLMGEHALNYVRSGYGPDDSSGDNRMNRQKQYLGALFSQMREAVKRDISLPSRAALKMTDYIVSDFSVNKWLTIFEKLSAYTFDTIYSIDGKTVKGEQYMEFYPDEDSVKEIVIDCFYEVEN